MKCFHPKKRIFCHSNDELTSLLEYPLCKEHEKFGYILSAYSHVNVGEALDVISLPFIGQILSWGVGGRGGGQYKSVLSSSMQVRQWPSSL